MKEETAVGCPKKKTKKQSPAPNPPAGVRTLGKPKANENAGGGDISSRGKRTNTNPVSKKQQAKGADKRTSIIDRKNLFTEGPAEPDIRTWSVTFTQSTGEG